MKWQCLMAAVATGCMALLSGCSEVYINIDGGAGGESGNGGNSGGGSDPTNLVTFHAAVESRRMETRSMSPIARDVKAQLFAYDAGGPQTGTAPVTSGVYEASVPGMLSGMNGYRMYLTTGAYDFYGFSENMSYTPLPFEEGKSPPLFNGVDYLWWHADSQDVDASQINIPITFLHRAAQVVFEVGAGDGIRLDQLVAAHITAPVQGAQMDLITGVIPPATSYITTAPDKMGVNGTLAQYIMLPLKTTVPMHASFTVKVNGESGSRTYTVDIPVPNGELEAGNSYRYAVVIQANGVDFSSVNVTGWVDVDETGKPLYPVQ